MTRNKANTPVTKVDGLIFDKDGTLFDFHATWSTASAILIEELADGDDMLRQNLAREMHFDLTVSKFRPTSPIIAGTNREAAECVARALPDRDLDEIEQMLETFAIEAPLAPAVPLPPLMDGFLQSGLQLGVMTNDSEAGARANLGNAGIEDRFAFIAGFDSGHGCKPAPDPLLAFCKVTGLTPGRVAMVGDSIHDLIAGRAAGMQTIAVLTGVAEAPELAPFADVVMADIGEIPHWLSQ